jgi:hypothetical protein
VICNVVTKYNICSVLTAPAICLEKTKFCPVATGICPPKSLACGRFPPIDVDPRVPPVNLGPGGQPGPEAWYGQSADDAAEDLFWFGYYSALDAVAEAEAERDGES